MSGKKITFEAFQRGFSAIVGHPISFVESNGYTLDLFFSIDDTKKESEFDHFSLFITGKWEILLGGKTILSNFLNDDVEDIMEDSNVLRDLKLISVKFFEQEKEVYFEFEDKYFVHVLPNENNGWVELLRKDGEYFTTDETGNYFLKK